MVTDGPSARGATRAFGFVTTLFFAWGFATSLLDPLIAAVRRVFSLSYTEALLTTFAWFIAYGVASLPAALLLARLGYAKTLVAALGIMVAGCLFVPVATWLDWYPGVLLALFVVASGVTLLQVAANPLVAALGPEAGSHFRLNLSQGFNSLGTTIGPWLGAHLFLTGGVFAAGAVVTLETRASSLRSIDFAFVGMAALFTLLAGFIFAVRRQIGAATAATPAAVAPLEALRSPWAVFGAFAIFVYVGSEVTIGSLLTNFLSGPRILDVPLESAGKMVAYYWGGAMVGRFIGSVVLTRVPATRVLVVACLLAAGFSFAVTRTEGGLAAGLALSIGLFNSIMFPTIFTLTLERSTASVSATSGLLVFGIIGGALLPQLAGFVVDRSGVIHQAFYVPCVAYLLLVGFGLACARSSIRHREAISVATSH